MTTYQITWVHAGTMNAAMLGLDETIESDATPDQVREDAEYHAQAQGIDLDRYTCVVETV